MAKRLYVGNLSYSTPSESLSELFSEFGTVVDCTVVEGKGFGFVEFETDESAEEAMESLNGTELDGRQIRVDVAKARSDNRRSGGGGGGGGGYRDRDRGGRDRW
ncbi:MAG: RNA-binding protein [Candidatus Poribacteria bacterium]|nr:RNA-binding protein [Candidatus Poribacteria bacterium]